MAGEVFYGGLDLAKRIDHSAFILLKFHNKRLEQVGQKIWPHINYSTVAMDVLKIQRKYLCAKICFDRSGVGDAAQELFSREIPLEEVVTSLPKKMEMLNLIKSLFHNKRLLIKDKELYKQVLEQEEYKSEAGNILYRHPSSTHDDAFWALAYACYAAKGHYEGKPNYSMRRIDRQIKRNISSIDANIQNELGEGWSISGR